MGIVILEARVRKYPRLPRLLRLLFLLAFVCQPSPSFVLPAAKMGRFAAFATAAAVLVPAALGIQVGGNGETCSHEALGYLACRYPLSSTCIEEVGAQAVAFCSSFLSLTATSFSTDLLVTTTTVVEITVSQTTEISTTTTTSDTTITNVSTETNTSATSTVTTTSYVPPEQQLPGKIKRRGRKCPDLSKKPLSRRPASSLSSVCSCLGVTATTVVTLETITASSTETDFSTSTSISTTTSIDLEVSVSTITALSTTTTITDVVATSTTVVDYCDTTYSGNDPGTGDALVSLPSVASGRDCCLLCWITENCVAAAYPAGCQLLIKITALDGAPTSPQCPLGIENYPFGPSPGVIYRGPCSPGLN
ncbi:hypothetical protein B0H67DRAFT_340811 [Lasiosphaeris hirsuta]|uniref:Uncharacterized protein n=1 Tax=Lasiosphaeris hirsuta TaxID=260670 RepID=A0AA40A376_9PEZI|nr:hypothetical protein B0H67DRAFT_340811 [Lasiosphaeris hirsuta]